MNTRKHSPKYYTDQDGEEHEVHQTPSHAEVMRRAEKWHKSEGRISEAKKIHSHIAIHKSKERHQDKALKNKINK